MGHGHRNLLFLALAVSAALSAQKLLTTAEAGGNLPSQPVNANDLLSIAVYGAPELSRTARVGPDGAIRLPMLRQKVMAGGRLPAEIETQLAEALTAERILVDPVVTVTIAEYGSRPVSVAGAVRHPLTFDARGTISLLDALARAEGLTSDAGGEILVTHPAAGSRPALVERVSVRELLERANPAANLALEGGEEVRVPEAGRLFVVGNVRKPGAFRVDDAKSLTILQALAMSEGLSPFAAKEAFIYRTDGSGAKQEIAVALRKIMERKSPDVVLGPNDIFYVPDNRKGRVTATAIERALSFAAGTASGALILSVNR